MIVVIDDESVSPDLSLHGPGVLSPRYPRVPSGTASVEVASKDGPAVNQSRHIHAVYCISATLDSGPVVDVDEPCLSNLLSIRRLPHV